MVMSRTERFESWREKERTVRRIVKHLDEETYLIWDDLDNYTIGARFRMFMAGYSKYVMARQRVIASICNDVYNSDDNENTILARALASLNGSFDELLQKQTGMNGVSNTTEVDVSDEEKSDQSIENWNNN
jgi:hypothetical protein